MNLIYGAKQVMHRIRVKLYPNYLPHGEQFLARTDNEASLSIEEVCAAMKNRGGYKGEMSELTDHIQRFFTETTYQLCDGFAVNTGYFSVYPNLGGTFKTVRETPDPKKHPLTFRFRPLKPLRDLAGHIEIVIQGEAEVSGYIDSFTDTDEHAENSIFVPGNGFIITGDKIKIAGEDPSLGLYLVPVDGTEAPVKITRIIENTSSKITSILPSAGSGYYLNRLEIRTQYTGSTTIFLKEPRVITSGFTLEEA
jgi:hypothetical protein